MDRLPPVKPATDHGDIYVARTLRGHKIGFSRGNVRRRVRDCRGVLLFTIRTGQRPSVLENVIHKHFAGRRVYRREWFDLSAADLSWLYGLSKETESRWRD